MPEAPFAYQLISFRRCPFAQRAVIMLEERQVPYTLVHIDPKNKPDWFLELSPLGKVPVLRVKLPGGEEAVVFESAVICELIDETAPGARMHPDDPLRRAHNRAWVEAASELVRKMHRVEAAADEAGLRSAADAARALLRRFDAEVKGPLFNGERFSLVDAAAAPVLQRLSWCDELEPSLELFGGELQRLRAWRDALFARPAVQRSTVAGLREVFLDHVRQSGGWIARGPG
jgi:glutathione S-transferase